MTRKGFKRDIVVRSANAEIYREGPYDGYTVDRAARTLVARLRAEGLSSVLDAPDPGRAPGSPVRAWSSQGLVRLEIEYLGARHSWLWDHKSHADAPTPAARS